MGELFDLKYNKQLENTKLNKVNKFRLNNLDDRVDADPLFDLFKKKPTHDSGQMNHLYFYEEVDKDTCLELAQQIRKTGLELQKLRLVYDLEESPKIYLHINSLGGCVFSAFTVVDAILQSKVPVVTIVEGACASAATIISITGHERRMGEYGYFLMHQLRSGHWGKMNELDDEYDNCLEIMRRIKSHYVRFSNGHFKETDLDDILKHDIWWTAKDCIEHGLIDKIMTGNSEDIGSCININKKSTDSTDKTIEKKRKR